MNSLSKLKLKFNLLDLKHTFSFKFVFMKRLRFPAHFVSILMELRLLIFSIDLSRIPVNKNNNARLGWTKYSDLYKLVHPSLDLISLCLLTGA